MEEFADGLAHYQLKGDQKREKKRHGDYWLLTGDVAAEIEASLEARNKESERSKEETQDPEEIKESDRQEEDNKLDNDFKVPAAELLNLPSWLRLSELFMYHSPESEENWTNFISKTDETPSMYHTAFQDFHNLTISITRRLVQASIFQAMSRLRARDRDQPTAVVNSTDVRTVADMMA